MTLRTQPLFFAVAFAASTAHGQDAPGMADVLSSATAVHYDRVISPETFTFKEDLAWAVRSLLRPEETLGNAIIMYGYDFTNACAAAEDRNLDTPVAHVAPPQLDQINEIDLGGQTNGLYAVTLYETIHDACLNEEIVQSLANQAAIEMFNRYGSDDTALPPTIRAAWADATGASSYLSALVAAGRVPENVIVHSSVGYEDAVMFVREWVPGYIPVELQTVEMFSQEIAQIQTANRPVQPLLFSVGRLPGAGSGFELWAFCDEPGQVNRCLGHPEWSGESPSSMLSESPVGQIGHSSPPT